jgi:hypothetical protein
LLAGVDCAEIVLHHGEKVEAIIGEVFHQGLEVRYELVMLHMKHLSIPPEERDEQFIIAEFAIDILVFLVVDAEPVICDQHLVQERDGVFQDKKTQAVRNRSIDLTIDIPDERIDFAAEDHQVANLVSPLEERLVVVLNQCPVLHDEADLGEVLLRGLVKGIELFDLRLGANLSRHQDLMQVQVGLDKVGCPKVLVVLLIKMVG